MKNIFILILGALTSGCFHETCETKTKRIVSLEHDFRIVNSYAKDHASWIVGINNDQQMDTFQYYSFLYLTEVAKPNSRFIKKKGDTIFKVIDGNVEYILRWNCNNGGGLVRVDTIK